MGRNVKVIKGKEIFIEEVASMKNEELFGIESCGANWEGLFKKHLAFDVLCLGISSCDGELCLEKEIIKKL